MKPNIQKHNSKRGLQFKLSHYHGLKWKASEIWPIWSCFQVVLEDCVVWKETIWFFLSLYCLNKHLKTYSLCTANSSTLESEIYWQFSHLELQNWLHLEGGISQESVRGGGPRRRNSGLSRGTSAPPHRAGDRLLTAPEWRELWIRQDPPPSREEDSLQT